MVKNASWTPDKSYLFRWTNAWFGPAGATTHTHYDISHNFYAQIYGIKRFILFPPEQNENLYLFPFLHPGAQQSQVNFDDPNLRMFPKFIDANATEAVLKPGDVLYLPPMWFHHVTALTTSMSVSVWTSFEITQKMYQTVRSILPFKSSWSKNKIALGGRIYLQILLDSLYGEGISSNFIARLVENRFLNLFETASGVLSKDKSYCEKDLLPETRDEILKESGKVFEQAIKKQLELFTLVENGSVRDIWLENLCEQLALTVAGIKGAGAFLLDMARC